MSVSQQIALCLLIVSVALGQDQTEKGIDAANTISRVCGQLLHVDHRIPGRVAGVSRVDASALNDTPLSLYVRDDKSCCDGLVAIREAKTDANGLFKFGNIKPGRYWLVSAVAGRQYNLPFRLKTGKDMKELCPGFYVDDSGKIEIVRTLAWKNM